MSIVGKTLEKISSTFFENNAYRYDIDVHVLHFPWNQYYILRLRGIGKKASTMTLL
jgi:hypothetical protein